MISNYVAETLTNMNMVSIIGVRDMAITFIDYFYLCLNESLIGIETFFDGLFLYR